MLNIKELETEEIRLSDQIKKEKKINSNEFIMGGLFDNKTFNNKLNSINKLSSERKEIIDKINLEKLKYEPLDYNKKTIGDLKQDLLNDTILMFNELYQLKSFDFNKINDILNKKYRKITLLIIFLLFLILLYSLINFLE
jgi:hypothetical protein